jgi:flagellar FliL protein
MSEKAEKKEEGKKKGGKLPIIIAAVVLLGGGGFFMMKKGDGKKTKPKVEIGHDIVDVGEVLVNLNGGGDNYARVNVGLQFVKGYDTHSFDAGKTAVRDAIIMVLSSKQVEELRSKDGKSKLKVEIAAAINHAFHAMHPAEPSEAEKDSKDKKDKEGKSEEGHGAPADEHGADPKAKREHPEWDSDEGPVLKVHFGDFVTQ